MDRPRRDSSEEITISPGDNLSSNSSIRRCIVDLRLFMMVFSLGYPILVYLYGKDFILFSDVVLFYPVLINLGAAGAFGLSLIYPPSLIERIACQTEPGLDERGIKYTRAVTKIWFGFCLSNSLISLCTVILADMELWAIYNGCISYILIGILFAGEYVFRGHYKRKSGV